MTGKTPGIHPASFCVLPARNQHTIFPLLSSYVIKPSSCVKHLYSDVRLNE